MSHCIDRQLVADRRKPGDEPVQGFWRMSIQDCVERRAGAVTGITADEDPKFKVTISHLRLVVAIEEERSLVGAARRLNMTQPAATKALQVAETLLGVALFERKSYGMIATTYGASLAAQARTILLQLAHAAQNLGDLRDGIIGRVYVGTLPTPTKELLPSAIMAVHRSHPNLSFEIVEATNEELIAMLAKGDLDLVIGRLPGQLTQDGLVQEVLYSEQISIVCGRHHPLAGHEGLNLADLQDCKWILTADATSLRQHVNGVFRDAGLEPPHPIIETRCLLLTQSLIQKGDYITAWPWEMIASDIEEGHLSLIPADFALPQAEIGLIYRMDTPLSPMAARLIEALRQISAEIETKLET